MNLYAKLLQRQSEGAPIRVGLIGAGKFGSMYLSQVRTTPGVHLLGIADLSVDRARAALGAFVAVSSGLETLFFRQGEEPRGFELLTGFHGGLLPDEVQIPLIVA